MSSTSTSIKEFWNYLWQLHYKTKDIVTLRFLSPQYVNNKIAKAVEENEQEREKAYLNASDESESKEKEEVKKEDIIPDGDESAGGGGGGMDPGDNYGGRQKVGLFLGPLLFVIFLLIPTPPGMEPEAQRVLASTAWVACWWITEAIPIPATSLLPVVLFPMTGALGASESMAPYANPNVFLFLGGFTIAVCMESWNLHRRIALNIINIVGTSPTRLILGFMVATAFLSMWISNTATTMMMMPIGLAVIVKVAEIVQKKDMQGIDVRKGYFKFGTGLMLSIGYAASIGGVATLIGTPPNITFAGVADEMFGQTIAFDQWFMYGLPLSIVFLLIAWLYMTKIAYPPEMSDLPGGKEVIQNELKQLGKITSEEKKIAVVFAFVAIAWISRSFLLEDIFPMIHDATIGILGAVITFLIPVDISKGKFLNSWETAVKVPWGILLLFGGGLSIAAGFSETGLAVWIGERLSILHGTQMIIIMLAVVALVIFLTEITSNTATTSMMMPIMASMAAAMQVHPYALMITAATAASYAFMLPVATPPNAVVFGSGYITIPQMAKAGIWLNLIAIVVITVLVYIWLPVIWGIDVNVFPSGW
ncbi:SLC13 family permease [Natranaerofaba carboxydovora]|uniref:SLC13 family permease n=1 Tax=Natranaerofaba carboxydovora TaxID=2742683 RepID=UPI001F147167|nr:DASS family sodium-coupled anion symporter [Natranaerofaba carboxydovora]UMZ74822.1 Sodium-dependent dicarboxylate transporter SdcS [Natranaerofaba carboxydovora]